MSSVFVVRNQHGHYLNKQGEWVDGREGQTLYRSAHRDEAINTVFEASARDISIRAEAVPCDLDARGVPRVEVGSPQLALTEPDPAGSDATADASDS